MWCGPSSPACATAPASPPSGCSAGREGALRRRLGGADVDLRVQRAVHRAFVGDLKEPLALVVAERAVERDGAVDAVDLAFFGLAVGTVGGVDLAVLERH